MPNAFSNFYQSLFRFKKAETGFLFKKAKQAIKEGGLDIRRAPKAKDYGKLLIVISKKTGNAPQRNLMRRRLKSIFYEEKLYDSAYDFLIIVYKPSVSLSFDALKKNVLRGLS